MKRAQSEIIYLVITLSIAFLVVAGIFAFSKTFQTNMNEQLANVGLERTATQLEVGFLKLKEIVDTTNEHNANLTLQIPAKIGEQRYTIAGFSNNVIELRTVGNPSVFRLLNLKFWNVSVSGFVDSQQGSIDLQLLNATSVLLK
jgi:hypothetical protein